jgi:hypothetical protein
MIKKIDVFPAIIILAPPDSLPDYASLIFTEEKPPDTRRVDRCRVTIFDGKLFVVIDSPEGFQVIFREKVLDYVKLEKQHNALTESGKIVAFRKDDNCGCGSRLRSWSPFGNYLSSTHDPEPDA